MVILTMLVAMMMITWWLPQKPPARAEQHTREKKERQHLGDGDDQGQDNDGDQDYFDDQCEEDKLNQDDTVGI